MGLNIDNTHHERRPVGFSIAGLLLLMLSGFVVYDIMLRKSEVAPVDNAYEYKINQSVEPSVTYFNSSFFDASPGTNTAYVSSLTDKLRATLRYNFHASEQAELRYAYEVKALVRGNHIVQNNVQQAPSVWSKDIQLVPTTRETLTTDDITLSPQVSVSYADYKKQIEQLKSALALPLASSVTIQMITNVAGTIGGTPFNDTRVSSVTAPIDEQIYTLAVKYDKFDSKKIIPQDAQKSRTAFEQYETVIAALLGVVGLAALVYGLRKQIFKTPYQRELDRIYRYHDGIIIKASTETDVTGKNIVPVQSFDDMLNLEEELKSPIVANPAGTEATQFMILHDDVIYCYTLGKMVLEDEAVIDEIDIEPIKRPVGRRKK